MRAISLAALACVVMVAGVAYAGAYDAVRIVAPNEDETVHDNNGNVAVVVRVSPPLDVEAGDRIVLLMDGSAVASGRDARFDLKGVDRGTHVLQAQVTAAGGSVLAASPQVSFHMWRASRLSPGRKD
ncbi:MAG: hypothetical protein EPO20_03960 [Betaproteobacteria bacterium]|nr:MAG: hypothetical protein EPO20_03960 [Betaproteobacteria bacterium]